MNYGEVYFIPKKMYRTKESPILFALIKNEFDCFFPNIKMCWNECTILMYYFPSRKLYF